MPSRPAYILSYNFFHSNIDAIEEHSSQVIHRTGLKPELVLVDADAVEPSTSSLAHIALEDFLINYLQYTYVTLVAPAALQTGHAVLKLLHSASSQSRIVLCPRSDWDPLISWLAKSNDLLGGGDDEPVQTINPIDIVAYEDSFDSALELLTELVRLTP